MENNLFNNKNAQQILGLSFGVIFSIILIVFFIVVAGIVINSFLKVQNCARLGIFIKGFGSDIKNSWNSEYTEHEFKGNLPSSIDYVCFANLTESFSGEFKEIGRELSLFEGKKANMFFYPASKACEMPYHYINHLDSDIVKTKNPNCFPVYKGEINLKIKKGLSDRFVGVE